MMTKPNDSQDTARATPKRKRCAIYARYSSEMQRESSIEDQIRKCREYAAKQGWIVLEEYVLYDQAVSGTSLGGRDGINSLVTAAKQRPRPFDLLVIDSTSRLARNLVQGLTIIRTLEFSGIHLVSVSQNLNSGDKSAKQLFTLFGMLDEQFIENHANDVRRGQEGRVLKGHITGGRCYGYKNVPVEDPTQKGDYGRPAVIGVLRQVILHEADVVRSIFEMYASGFSLDKIARTLRAKQVPAPCPPRKNSIRAWSAEGISAILRNEKYIGIHIWKRTTTVRDAAGTVATRPVPKEEWVQYEVPTWRIVSDELWDRVREELERKKHFGVAKHGGLSRTERSQKYLFSGLLFCGLCEREGRGERSITIVDGSGDAVRYGCGLHRYKGACANATTVGQDRLEEQLLPWLTCDLLEGNRLEQAIIIFQAQVQKRVSQLQTQARKNAINAPELRKELEERKQEAWNLTDFIVASGRRSLATVEGRLAAAEERIKEIEDLLGRAKEPEPIVGFSTGEIKEQLLDRVRDLQSVLTSTPLVGKQIIRKHIRKITLTPGEAGGNRVFHVAVEFELDSGNSGVMLSESVDAFSQQYGFTMITITGLVLDTTRVRKKRVPLPAPAEHNGAPSAASANVVPNPNLAAEGGMPASEAGAA